MKTAAKLSGFSMMLSFLVFIWLSHTGVIGGSYVGNFWGGVGFLVIAISGLFVLAFVCKEGGDSKLFNSLTFSYGLLLILNAIFYVILKTADLIGPYPPAKDSGLDVLLGVFYVLLAIGGAAIVVDTSRRN